MQNQSESRETISQFEKLLAGLAKAGVDFTVVGGVAVILNGYGRVTLDADILINDAPENVGRMLNYLNTWGEGWARELQPEDFVVQEGAIRVMEEFDLDIFTRMMGKPIEYFRPNLRFLETSGTRVPYISPSDLIFLKKDSWRDKDKLDVLAMQEIIAREQKKTV